MQSPPDITPYLGKLLPAMTAEDFGFMLEEVPGAYGFIGNGAGGKPGINLHNAAYDFNDDNLALGARFWDRLARDWFASVRA
jgi:metal-dependent amidase/aminoacylase/carboxypeptidase family protein